MVPEIKPMTIPRTKDSLGARGHFCVGDIWLMKLRRSFSFSSRLPLPEA